jgi:NRPS condensation-like uncharacterized protein
MSTYRVEALDEYMRLQEKSNDHHIRIVLHFKSKIDIEKLKKSIRLSFQIVPVLGCKFVHGKKKSYWENSSIEYKETDYFKLIEGNLSDNLLNRALTMMPDKYAGPQVCFTIIRQTDNDILCLSINHMVFDGTGAKEYIYLLAGIYKQKTDNINAINRDFGFDRRISTLLKNLSFKDTLRILFQKSIKKSGSTNFFDQKSDNLSPNFLLLKLGNSEYAKIKHFCNNHKITINDLMLSLFLNALIQQNISGINENITIATMIDLRRYAKKWAVSPFGNFASMIDLQIENKNQNIPDIISEVNKKMNKIKTEFPGIKSILLLNIASKFISKNVLEKSLLKKIESASISSTNIGVIDKEKIQFDEFGIENTYIIAALKNKPNFQLTFSTFNETITMSMSGNYSENDCKKLREILASIKDTILII